jgi:hypothetical protein
MVTSRDGMIVCKKCHYPDASYEERDRPQVSESSLMPEGLGKHDDE